MGPKVRVACAISSVSALVVALPLLAPTAHATPVNGVPPLQPGQVIRIGPIAGTGTPTKDYGIGATDLCEFMEFTTELLQVCGDSFAGQGVGFGGWYSPVALHVDRTSLDAPDGVRYTGVSGVQSPLLADPTPPGWSQLPAGVVSINRENYLMITTTASLRPQTSRLVKAEATQDHWETIPGSERDAGHADGRQSQISGYYDPIPTPDSETGWVYIVANNFDRSGPAVLYRVPPADFTDRDRWQGWSTTEGWGKPPTPLWPDRIGEMSVRQLDGKAVLSYFNASTGNMEMRVANDPTGLGSAPVTTVVRAYSWPEPADSLPPPEVNQLAQPYGGYIAPGSTLDEVRVFVSQWNTESRERGPYRVIQFVVNPFTPWQPGPTR